MSGIQRILLRVSLPLIVFMLIALWPQRVLLAWLVFGLLVFMAVAFITMQLIHTLTEAKVELDEEAIRLERLHADERLAKHVGIAPQNGWRRQAKSPTSEERRPSRLFIVRHSPTRQLQEELPIALMVAAAVYAYLWC